MGKASKDKGKVGEREVVLLLKELGFAARRGQQFAGGGDSPDVIGPEGLHIEVKRTETFRLWDALDQSREDAKPGNVPIVLHRRNDKPWVVVLDARDFFRMLEIEK